MESLLSSFLYALHPLHGHDRLAHQVTIVLHRTIATFFEFKRGVDGEFFAPSFAIGFRPCHLARIAFLVEVAMAFGPTEAKGFGVVADEEDAVAGVAGGGAEVAFFDAHFGSIIWSSISAGRQRNGKVYDDTFQWD